jgi:hypothetical protein
VVRYNSKINEQNKFKFMEVSKMKKTTGKLTRTDVLSGIDGLKHYLLNGNEGKAFECSSETYQEVVKAIRILEDELDTIKEEEGFVACSTPCRHTLKAPKERKTRKPKVELKWNRENIRELLNKNDKMIEKSIVKIFENQTADEQSTEETSHDNGIGFSGCDAKILSSFAKQILEGRILSSKQLEIARKKMMKYAGQLARIANELEAEKQGI